MKKTKYPHFKPPADLDKSISTVRTSSHSTYNLNYHFVWIPKYRKPILKHDKLKEILESIIRGQSESRDWQVLALEIQPDHIHLFLSVPPSYSPSEVMNIIKGNTSRQLRLVFPHLRTIIRKSLWASGYYVSTAGYVSQEQVRKYIEEQSKKLGLRFDKKLDTETKELLEQVNESIQLEIYNKQLHQNVLKEMLVSQKEIQKSLNKPNLWQKLKRLCK